MLEAVEIRKMLVAAAVKPSASLESAGPLKNTRRLALVVVGHSDCPTMPGALRLLKRMS